MKRLRWAPLVLGLFMVLFLVEDGRAHTKPNILVIWGDDIGMWNISAYHRGMMGGRTPNIDRISREGALFTDAYAQSSSAAGRSAFITGQHPIRTGLLTLGMPGAKFGLQATDPTIAELLKDHGYLTGQFGENHLGDRNEYLPTVHGFDQFYGNLYYIVSKEEPENPDYPNNPTLHKHVRARGVLKCRASDVDDPTIHPRWGRVGKQICEDTGPLTRKRMETIDEDFLSGTLKFMETSVKASDPFFIWHNSTRTQVWTHLQEKYQNATGFGLYADAMKELDDQVGTLLKSSRN